jgi:hypothetical protein
VKEGTAVSDSTSALVIKRIADEWRPSKPGVTMYAAPEMRVKAEVGSRRGDRRTQATERNRDG